MRTTVDIDDDILTAVREIAKRQRVSIGKALSELARQALLRQEPMELRNGVPLFPAGAEGEIVTMELVNRLRDEDA